MISAALRQLLCQAVIQQHITAMQYGGIQVGIAIGISISSATGVGIQVGVAVRVGISSTAGIGIQVSIAIRIRASSRYEQRRPCQSARTCTVTHSRACAASSSIGVAGASVRIGVGVSSTSVCVGIRVRVGIGVCIGVGRSRTASTTHDSALYIIHVDVECHTILIRENGTKRRIIHHLQMNRTGNRDAATANCDHGHTRVEQQLDRF